MPQRLEGEAASNYFREVDETWRRSNREADSHEWRSEVTVLSRLPMLLALHEAQLVRNRDAGVIVTETGFPNLSQVLAGAGAALDTYEAMRKERAKALHEILSDVGAMSKERLSTQMVDRSERLSPQDQRFLAPFEWITESDREDLRETIHFATDEELETLLNARFPPPNLELFRKEWKPDEKVVVLSQEAGMVIGEVYVPKKGEWLSGAYGVKFYRLPAVDGVVQSFFMVFKGASRVSVRPMQLVGTLPRHWTLPGWNEFGTKEMALDQWHYGLWYPSYAALGKFLQRVDTSRLTPQETSQVLVVLVSLNDPVDKLTTPLSLMQSEHGEPTFKKKYYPKKLTELQLEVAAVLQEIDSLPKDVATGLKEAVRESLEVELARLKSDT